MQTSTDDISDRANRLVELKSCIDFLDKTGNLIRVKSEVDAKYELAGIIYASHKSGCGKAMLFEKVKDSAYPVLCGMLLDREIIASVFGVSTSEVSSFMGTCLDNWRKDKDRFPSTVLEKAPANEVIEKEINLDNLPVPLHALKDGGRYFNSSVMIVRNPITGVPNISLRRFMITGKDRMTFLIDPERHLGEYLAVAESRNETLPITLNIGMGPAVWFAAAMPKQGDGKVGIASHMIGRPIDFIKANSIDTYAFADAQFVVEAEILPGVREDEGPSAEVTGHYATLDKRWVARVTGISRRQEPIFQTLLSGPESFVATGFSGEANLLEAVKVKVPQVKAVYLSSGGGGYYQAIVQVENDREGVGREAIMETFSAFNPLQWVVAVDTDVDIYDANEITWAISMRFNADTDLILLKNEFGHMLNPMVTINAEGDGATITKMGMDATVPFSRKEELTRVAFQEVDLANYEMQS
jgi:2,5-furandicarboxylate decarboxylase 1